MKSYDSDYQNLDTDDLFVLRPVPPIMMMMTLNMLLYTFSTRKQSEPPHFRQSHVVCQVAAPYSVWQRFPLCPIESNVNENLKVIQNPGFLPDHPQNWITGSFCHSRHSQKISERFVHNFLSYLADTQTDRQTVWQKHNLLGGGNNPQSIVFSTIIMWI